MQSPVKASLLRLQKSYTSSENRCDSSVPGKRTFNECTTDLLVAVDEVMMIVVVVVMVVVVVVVVLVVDRGDGVGGSGGGGGGSGGGGGGGGSGLVPW